MEFKNFKNLLNEENKQKIKSKSERIIIAILIILFIALISAFNSVSTTEEVEEVEKEREAGDLNEEGNAQEIPDLTATESHQRFIELCEKYDLPADVIWHTENFYGLKEGTILCIAIAETSGGKKGYGVPGCWNYGNVGNTDNPNNRRCFANQGAGLAAIGKTLNNSLLGSNQTIACLNGAGNCIEQYATGYRYSTGKSGNWERNMIACFHSIYKTPIDPTTFNIHNR